MLASCNQRARPALTLAAIAALGLLAYAGAFPAAGLAASGAAAQAGLPGPRASVEAKLRAYAKRCASLGTRADARVKGSDVAACLDAMARLGSGQTRSPREACRGVSRRHVKGRARSARASCVAAGSKVARDRRGANRKSPEPAAPVASTPAGAVPSPGDDSDFQAGADLPDTSDLDTDAIVDGVLDVAVDDDDSDEDPGE
jgi:hypothetical protein